MSSPLAIGIDVGGTTVKAVVASDDATVLLERRRPTPRPDPTGRGVVEVVASLLNEIPDSASLPVGVVVPGVVDEDSGRAVHSANLGWSDIPLASMLRDACGREIGFGHDVRAGALAEARWGAAVDAPGVVAFVPIGTGMAAALLIDGVPLVAGGWAGEIGQPLLHRDGYAGVRVEEIASASGTARRAGAADARTVAERVRSGDDAARAVWDETVEVLADALAGMTASAGVQTIVIGGGLALAGETLLDPLRRALEARLGILRRPALVAALLGDRAAALGAALIAQGPS